MTIEVPDSYIEKEKHYGELFADYLSMNIIVLGVYRQINEVSDENLLNDEFSFLAEDRWRGIVK